VVTRLQQAKPTIENKGLKSHECINVGTLNHLLKLEKCTNLRQKVKLPTYPVKHNAIKKKSDLEVQLCVLNPSFDESVGSA
jgi:hypothetical protein